MNQDFLFELGCEELPAGELAPMAKHLEYAITKRLKEAKLEFAKITTYYTPRRLAVFIKDLMLETQAQIVERRGPAKNASTQAIQGFLKSCSATEKDLIEIETDKGTWLAVKLNQPAVSAKVILKEAIETAIKTLPMKKTMRWDDHDFAFLRPVHWLVALLGEEVVPIEMFGLKAGCETFGHRFHHPAAIALKNPGDYVDALRKAYVMVDRNERKATIVENIKSHPARLGKLEEVLDIVEWPVPLLCTFEKEFLDVPQEVLISTMEANQRVFPVVNGQGALQNQFWAVANIKSKYPKSVIHGNEKVVHARLSDATFFYNEDLKIPLEEHLAALDKITFQQGLGTLLDKAKRLESLMETAQQKRAAKLCKADLVTQMVQEFPELQGYMGHQYALKQGENSEIAEAIEDHYKPKGRGGELPRTEIGARLALADKIDTLVGLFAIGKEPTSSGDPYALRRQALGVIAILVGFKWSLDLEKLINKAYEAYQSQGHKLASLGEVSKKLQIFFKERMENWYRDEQPEISIQNVYFVLGKPGLVLDPYAIFTEVNAFANFQKTKEGQQLCQMVKRLSGIRDESVGMGAEKQYANVHEQKLLESYTKAEKGQWDALPVEKRYSQFLEFATPLELFFENVMVNDPDLEIRKKRKQLVNQVYAQFKKLGDFSKL